MTHTEVAIQLTRKFTEYFQGTGAAPTHLFVGQTLFNVYLSGLGKLIRWSAEEPAYEAPPFFKTTKMEAVKSLGPWEIVFGRKVILEQTIE